MKTHIKHILIVIFILSIAAFLNKCHAQQQKASLMAGDKAFEISYISENEEGLGFGLAASVAHSGNLEKRANKNDHQNTHEFVSKATPAVFALISGNFEEVTVIGKIGSAYVNQNINGVRDSKKFFFAVGIAVEVPVYENISIKGSYDSVNSLMFGLTFRM